jgi:hypothetical protein
MILAATILLWVTATVLLQGQHGNVQSVRDTASPAYFDAVQARAALSDADRAAWQSFRSGEAQLTGPGQQYQNDITTAGEDLERLATVEPSGGDASQQLQTISGQLVTYEGLVEQADAANRTDIALGTASGHDLGYSYLTSASMSMRAAQGGLLASIDSLAGTSHRGLRRQLRSVWNNPVLLLIVAVADVLVLCSIIAAGRFLLRRFRRLISPPLVLAAVLAGGLLVWVAVVGVHADSTFAAARNTAVPGLTSAWQTQTRGVNAAARAFRADTGARGSPGLDVRATQPASRALNADLASADSTGGLPIGIPAVALAIAGLAYLGIKLRLDEYRG